MGAIGLHAFNVKIHGMRLDGKAPLLGDFLLPALDFLVMELLDVPAIDAHHMIMVLHILSFEHGLARFEMMPLKQPSLLELGQCAIHRGQADVHVFAEQHAIHIIRGQVPLLGLVEQLKNLHARESDLEPDVPQFS